MKISDLARLTHSTVQTIRYYEQEGLLPEPTRSPANYRQYSQAHLDRLRFIRNCRMLDMTHDEIRILLGLMDAPGADCGQINNLIDEHIGHVDKRIDELTQLKQQLLTLRYQCASEQAVASCGILHGLASMDAEPRSERQTHL